MSSIGNPNVQLVHDHFRRLYDDIQRGNRLLEIRAWGLMVLNALLLGVVWLNGGHWPIIIGISAVVGGSCCLIYTVRIRTRLPGGGTWDEVWDNYLDVDGEELFERVLAEVLESIDAGKNSNRRKGWALDGASLALLFQCVALVMAVAAGW